MTEIKNGSFHLHHDDNKRCKVFAVGCWWPPSWTCPWQTWTFDGWCLRCSRWMDRSNSAVRSLVPADLCRDIPETKFFKKEKNIIDTSESCWKDMLAAETAAVQKENDWITRNVTRGASMLNRIDGVRKYWSFFFLFGGKLMSSRKSFEMIFYKKERDGHAFLMISIFCAMNHAEIKANFFFVSPTYGWDIWRDSWPFIILNNQWKKK